MEENSQNARDAFEIVEENNYNFQYASVLEVLEFIKEVETQISGMCS